MELTPSNRPNARSAATSLGKMGVKLSAAAIPDNSFGMNDLTVSPPTVETEYSPVRVDSVLELLISILS